MAEKQCSTCNASVPDTAKFCPECGAELQTIRPKKRTGGVGPKSSKSRKRRKSKTDKKAAFWARVRQELIDTIGALSVIIVMPVIIIALSHWVGMIAAWLAIGIGLVYAVFSFWPRQFPMGSSKLKARLTCVMALLASLPAFFFGGMADELADLKESNVPAYLQKLREYKGEEQWLAAVKELTPENYAASVAQLKTEKDVAAQQAKREANERRFREAMKALRERAVASTSNGYYVTPDDLDGRWHLTSQQIRLRCEFGAVYNGKPRPLVLADANDKTYALNGAAISTGKYENGDSLALNGDTQTVNDLVPIGVAMCAAREEAECGTDAFAYGRAMAEVERRLKNPEGADFVASEIEAAMESCGVWLIKSAVDATNGFGAVIRTPFAAEVRRTPDGHWTTKVYFRDE